MSLRLIKHFFAIASGQIINLLGNLILLPLFLRHWTPLVYGEWLALSSLTSYLGTLDLGVNSAVGNRLLSAYTRGDREDYMRNQNSAAAFYLSLAVGGTLLTGLVAWLLPATFWTPVTRGVVPGVSWIVWLLALQVLWMMPVGLLINFYSTVADPARSKWLNNCKTGGALLMTVAGLLLGCRLRTMALLQLVPLAVVGVHILWDMRRRFPQFLPGLSHAQAAVMRELLQPSLMFALIMVAMSLSQQGSVLVVSSVFGGIAVTVFTAVRTLSGVAMQAVKMIATTAWPDATILYAAGDFARLRQLNRLVVTASMTLCVAISAALWFEGTSVIYVWLHLRVSAAFLRLMLLYLVLQAPWLANSLVPAAINQHQKLAWSYLASGVIAILSMVVLAPRLGMNAVPVGLIIGEALACYHFVLKDACALIAEPYAAYAARLWPGLALVFIAALLAGWLAHQSAWGPPVLRWGEVGAATLLISCLMARSLWVGASEWELLCRKADALKSRLRPRRVQTSA